jgi:molybdopterin molybdotransferase
MLSVSDAVKRILDNVLMLEPEEKSLLECVGQVLADDIVSTVDVPPHDNAAMDGYAVRSCDIESATADKPATLQVIGEIAAGYKPDQEVTINTAVRIMTGAMIPNGADAVVQFENTDELERKSRKITTGQIGVLRPAKKRLNIRSRGEDISAGQLVLEKRTLLRAAEIGVLASMGIPNASVIRRPVVSVLSTGDELCDIHDKLAEGQIYNSNAYCIAASIITCGGIPKIIGIGRDSIRSLRSKINKGIHADMMITSGGVSKGDYDLVKNVLAQLGKLSFWTVRMKPGKPLAFGTIHRSTGKYSRAIPLLGLPGNPTSCMIAFEQFARPAILKMMGRRVWQRQVMEAFIDSDILNKDGRRVFAGVKLSKSSNGYRASLIGRQGSGVLTSLIRIDGLAIISEDCPSVKAGDKVSVQMLDRDTEII